MSKLISKLKKINKNNLLKIMLLFIFYFIYMNIANFICQQLGKSFDLTVVLFADCIFMLIILFIYQNNIKEDLKEIKQNYSWKRVLSTILLWCVIIFTFLILANLITKLISSILGIASIDNAEKVVKTQDLYKISNFYTIFKTMIFGVIAEELLFRESIREIVKNKCLFILVSSVVYTIVNVIYTDLNIKFLLLNIISFFLPSLLLSTVYIKNNSNIVILMLIKFVYNLIPLTILILGL
ncbi:MAG: CPBP family intramembrane metalloprotease [Tenericutes bacterium]|nr:CPBP family intramembrane metalloprotease [Mycoplasmatota bacterium]